MVAEIDRNMGYFKSGQSEIVPAATKEWVHGR